VASDGLDGLVARLFNQKSMLGTYLDPLADKILLVSAFITLSVRGYLPAWLTVMVIARDVMIMLGIFFLIFNRMEFKLKPSIISKLTTCLQFIAVLSVLSKDYTGFPTLYYLFVYNLTALFTISSGLHYMHYWFKMMGEGGDNQGNIS
jgi:cardiolipin synthase